MGASAVPASSGGGNGWTLIETLSVSGTTLVNSTNSLAGYKRLRVVAKITGTNATSLFFNSDQGANYRWMYTVSGTTSPVLSVSQNGAVLAPGGYGPTATDYIVDLSDVATLSKPFYGAMLGNNSTVAYMSVQGAWTPASATAITAVGFANISSANGGSVYIFGQN
jgi:hypothetical protein